MRFLPTSRRHDDSASLAEPILITCVFIIGAVSFMMIMSNYLNPNLFGRSEPNGFTTISPKDPSTTYTSISSPKEKSDEAIDE